MKQIFLLAITLALLGIGIHHTAHSTTGGVIYFYNPETNINNFTTLKTEFDSYLSSKGKYQFQPVDDQNTFEGFFKTKNKNVYLLSSWHLDQLKKNKIPLEIFLLGTKKNTVKQRKTLSAKISVSGIEKLNANSIIAGAGNEDYIRSVLKQILINNKNLLASLKILTVPKDIDALMAVSFGMANAAITSETSLENMATINPNQSADMHPLGYSEENYLLVAATLEKADNEEKLLLEILSKMQESENGTNKLKLLGIDGWKKF